MDNTHYISTAVLSLETVNFKQILCNYLMKLKLIFRNVGILDKKWRLTLNLSME
jgi:hypothetical protein